MWQLTMTLTALVLTGSPQDLKPRETWFKTLDACLIEASATVAKFEGVSGGSVKVECSKTSFGPIVGTWPVGTVIQAR